MRATSRPHSVQKGVNNVRCVHGEVDSRGLPPSDEAAACTSRAIPGGRVLVCPEMVLVREVSDDDRSADDAGAPGGLLSERDHLRARARAAMREG